MDQGSAKGFEESDRMPPTVVGVKLAQTRLMGLRTAIGLPPQTDPLSTTPTDGSSPMAVRTVVSGWFEMTVCCVRHPSRHPESTSAGCSVRESLCCELKPLTSKLPRTHMVTWRMTPSSEDHEIRRPNRGVPST